MDTPVYECDFSKKGEVARVLEKMMKSQDGTHFESTSSTKYWTRFKKCAYSNRSDAWTCIATITPNINNDPIVRYEFFKTTSPRETVEFLRR